MTKQEIILDYVQKNQTPDQELCPVLVQHWQCQKNKQKYNKYWNNKTGEITALHNTGNLSCYISRSPSSYGYLCVYMKYVDEYEDAEPFIDMAVIHMDGHRHKEGETEAWTFAHHVFGLEQDRVFLFQKDIIPYGIDGTPVFQNQMGAYYNRGLAQWLHDLRTVQTHNLANKEFHKFAQATHINIRAWNAPLDFSWTWSEWYKRSAPRKISTNQKAINEVLAFPLTDLDTLAKKYPVINNGSSPYEDPKRRIHFYHFEMINDEWCVIRYLRRKDVYSNGRYTYSTTFKEPIRIYINKKGRPFVTEFSPVTETYQIKSVSLKSQISYNGNYFGNLEEITKWKPLSWVKSIVESKLFADKGNALVCILRHPILEVLYKSGYHQIVAALIQYETIDAGVRSLFDLDPKAKFRTLSDLKTNRAILSWIDHNIVQNHGSDYKYFYLGKIAEVIKGLKELFDMPSLNSWSQASVDKYFDVMFQLVRKSYSWKNELSTRWIHRYAGNNPLTEEEKKKIIHIFNISNKDIAILDMYIDTFRMYRSLPESDRPEIESIYSFKSYNEISLYHDAIVALYNEYQAEQTRRYNLSMAQRKEEEEKLFNKLQDKRRETYNFSTEEDKYIIKIPEKLSEITTEGQVLGHCVGGYVSNHARGETNILFLREKINPDHPFFTIEVNNNEVVQIHGKYNRWLGNEPEAAKFALKWVRKLGLKCSDRILLNKSTHYGAISDALKPADIGL